MAKPINLPSIGDKVRLRGRGAIGILERLTDRNWAIVIWKNPAPKIVHLFELERA